MTTKLYAQPYDISATGFYFDTVEEYQERVAKAVNDYGQPVEEFEIQFIDGDLIDCELANAWGINQANFAGLLEAIDDWDIDRKRHYIIVVGECGYRHSDVVDDPDGVEIDLYPVGSMRELAEQFVEEGLFGDIPERLQFYIDLDAIARDLDVDYSLINIAGEGFAYACR